MNGCVVIDVWGVTGKMALCPGQRTLGGVSFCLQMVLKPSHRDQWPVLCSCSVLTVRLVIFPVYSTFQHVICIIVELVYICERIRLGCLHDRLRRNSAIADCVLSSIFNKTVATTATAYNRAPWFVYCDLPNFQRQIFHIEALFDDIMTPWRLENISGDFLASPSMQTITTQLSSKLALWPFLLRSGECALSISIYSVFMPGLTGTVSA